MHVPGTEVPAVSGPTYSLVVHAATPDVASLPSNAIETARLYQPLALGSRAGTPSLTVGAVASYLTG